MQFATLGVVFTTLSNMPK